MDIEGAEPLAIKGALETFIKYRPKFTVCVYHIWEQRWTLPLALKELCPDYEFYLNKSHPTLETVLLDKPKELLI